MSPDVLAFVVDRLAVIETVDRLFVFTDRKDWEEVRALFADEVHFDMTSLGQGEPTTMTPKQITDTWRVGLRDVPVVHHQSSNHLVTLVGDEALVFCYATATHHRPDTAKPLTTIVGSYDLRLTRGATGWLITQFRFTKKYVV